MDKIKIRNLEAFAKHGVYPEENVMCHIEKPV